MQKSSVYFWVSLGSVLLWAIVAIWFSSVVGNNCHLVHFSLEQQLASSLVQFRSCTKFSCSLPFSSVQLGATICIQFYSFQNLHKIQLQLAYHLVQFSQEEQLTFSSIHFRICTKFSCSQIAIQFNSVTTSVQFAHAQSLLEQEQSLSTHLVHNISANTGTFCRQSLFTSTHVQVAAEIFIQSQHRVDNNSNSSNRPACAAAAAAGTRRMSTAATRTPVPPLEGRGRRALGQRQRRGRRPRRHRLLILPLEDAQGSTDVEHGDQNDTCAG